MSLSNTCLIVVILINFYTLGSSRLIACIRAAAIQGALLALLPILQFGITEHTLVLFTFALALKGVLIPWLLLRTVREVKIHRELEPIIGYVPTMIMGTLFTTAGFLFADSLPLLDEHMGGLFIPASLSTLSTGLLLLMSRRKAITQVVGYLIMENGIFIFSIQLLDAMPTMVEAGILLDLLVGIFVMAIVIHHINRTFYDINIDELSALKE